MEVQVNKEHYDFLSYVDISRWCSYYQQISEIIASDCNRIMLIGVGDGLICHIIKKIAPSIECITVDFDKDLQPDICCDILELSKFVEEKVDVVVCCQVLEHLPYEQFMPALQELSAVLNEHGKLILSLPDSGYDIIFALKVPKVHRINYIRRKNRFYKSDFAFNGEHYWEINSANKYSLKRIRKDLSSLYKINRCYSVPNNMYHKFFICEKKG